MATVKANVSTLVRRAQWRVAAFSLICVSALLTLAGLFALREYELRSMELVARSLAFAGEPALRFNDTQAMRELVDQVAASAQLAEVDIADRHGAPWLSYRRSESALADRCALGIERLLLPTPTTVQVGDDGAPLGRLSLRSDGRALLRYIEWAALSFLLCLVATALVVIAYSRRLVALIVMPLDALARLTRTVRESRSFERRAERASVHEIDALAADFNALLVEMQVKEAVINAHHAELKRSNESLRTLSRYDSLTQLPNRAYLGEHLAAVIETCRLSQRQAGLVFIDTDRFKEVNDRFGHAAGDALLVELSKRLRASIRDSDFVARLGGDEFIIVITPLRDSSEITRLTDRVRNALGHPVQLPGGSVVEAISVTMGVALYPDHAETTSELIHAADEAMYQAKSSAPGTVATFRPEARAPSADPEPSCESKP